MKTQITINIFVIFMFFASFGYSYTNSEIEIETETEAKNTATFNTENGELIVLINVDYFNSPDDCNNIYIGIRMHLLNNKYFQTYFYVTDYNIRSWYGPTAGIQKIDDSELMNMYSCGWIFDEIDDDIFDPDNEEGKILEDAVTERLKWLHIRIAEGNYTHWSIAEFDEFEFFTPKSESVSINPIFDSGTDENEDNSNTPQPSNLSVCPNTLKNRIYTLPSKCIDQYYHKYSSNWRKSSGPFFPNSSYLWSKRGNLCIATEGVLIEHVGEIPTSIAFRTSSGQCQ